MLLLPGADMDVAVGRAQLICDALAEYDFIEPEQVTGSFGVSCFRDEDSIDTFVKRADEALYAAKRNGRNRVEHN